jgi:hypothetical protein
MKRSAQVACTSSVRWWLWGSCTSRAFHKLGFLVWCPLKPCMFFRVSCTSDKNCNLWVLALQRLGFKMDTLSPSTMGIFLGCPFFLTVVYWPCLALWFLFSWSMVFFWTFVLVPVSFFVIFFL